MSHTKHTPGPWKINMLNVSYPLQDGDKKIVGYICKYILDHVAIEGLEPVATLETTEANARLIAAAPELLELLKAAHNIIRDQGEHYGGLNMTHEFRARILDIIAKATGDAE